MLYKKAQLCHLSTSQEGTNRTEQQAWHQKELIWGLDSGFGLWQSLGRVP